MRASRLKRLPPTAIITLRRRLRDETNRMPRNSPAPPRRPRAIGIATALMCALAGGAVWCLLSMYTRQELPAFAFVVALLVVWALRTHGYAGGWFGAALALACVAVASLYAFSLQAVAQIAALLGLPMRTAMQQMGPAMAFDIAWANLRGWNLGIVAAAAACAVGWMLRRGRLPGA